MKIEIDFKKLRKKMNKKFILLLLATILIHLTIVSVNSGSFKRHHLALKMSHKYYKEQLSKIKVNPTQIVVGYYNYNE